MTRKRTQVGDSAMGKALHDALEAAGLDARSVSLRAGLSESAARDIINGRVRNPRFATIEALATVIGVPVGQILGMTGADGRPAGSTARPGGFGVPILSTTPDRGGRDLARAGTVTPAQEIDGAFALYVPNNDNAPRVMAGEVVICHPNAPPLDHQLSVISPRDGELLFGTLERRPESITVHRQNGCADAVVPLTEVSAAYRVLAIHLGH